MRDLVLWLVSVPLLAAAVALGLALGVRHGRKRHVTAVRPGGLWVTRKPLTDAEIEALSERLAQARDRWTGRWHPVPDEHGVHHPIMREEVSDVSDECALCEAGVTSGNHTCGK